MREIVVEGWPRLLEELDDFDAHWLFRGQGNAEWDLKSSLERATLTYQSRSAAEYTLLHEFKRRAHNYLAQQQLPSENETAEWLALMQHFGAPTRLLDVTRSPFVATYFAVEDVADGDDCALWALSRLPCLRGAGEFLIGEDENGGQPASREFHKQAATGMKPDEALETTALLQAALLVDMWREAHVAVVLPFVPERLSERLSVQQGEFLLSHDVDRPFMESLSNLGDLGEGLRKYVIKGRLRGRILEQLRRMNITRAQLFPGLEGFAQSFRQLLIEEPADQRLARWQAMWEKQDKRRESEQ